MRTATCEQGVSIGNFQPTEILIGHAEIALKSRPVRRAFVEKLISNIRAGLEETGIKKPLIYKRGARILVRTDQVERACEALRRIFGIAVFAPCYHVKLQQLEEFLRERAGDLLKGAESFAVRVRREGRHPFTSKELESRLGSLVVERTQCKVDLSHPAKTIYVEVRGEDCHVYTEKYEGPGGLPLGTGGKVVCLISGGIDSPVAAWMMMKRGCAIVPLFAKFARGGDESDLVRFIEVVKELKRWSAGEPMKVFVYQHDQNLVEFRKAALRYTCILCRRMMYRVANELAKSVGAKAIVTGESLGQVASQTLDNLRAIDSASELPVFRPLIGMDKLESERIARAIGTYEKSSMRVRAGCAPEIGCWARPRKPVTKADPEVVAKIEGRLDIDGLLKRSVESLREITDLVLGE